MDFTDVTFDCYGVTVSPEVEEFRMEVTVNTQGELPKTAIFVYTIGAEDDLSSDSFARVANPQDLQSLLINRDTTIAADGTEYLASSVELQYDALDTATSAKALLKTRINELIRRWMTYSNDFIAESGVSKPYPSSDPAVEETLITDYTSAKVARVAAEEDVTTAETDLVTTKAATDEAQLWITNYQGCVNFVTTMSSDFYRYRFAILTEGADALVIRGEIEASLTARSAECSGQLQFWQNSKSALEADIGTATQVKIEAEQALAAAQAAEDEALAAVLDVLPDFDPASV